MKSHASLPEGYGFVGEDERVLQASAPRLHSLLADQISIEAGEGFMLFYQLNKLVEPEGIERFIDIGLQIRRQLSSTKLNREKQTP